jgi:hypothetical protein
VVNWFKKRKPEPPTGRRDSERPSSGIVGWAVAKIPEEELVRHLKEPKDVRVLVFSAGAVTAVCKACAEQIQPAEKDGLLWLVCPRCRGVTFVPLTNLPRDVELARREGGVFEYEVFFVHGLPPGLSPANEPSG